jgi:16S rRNA (guanine527-N7)-methyltransferase
MTESIKQDFIKNAEEIGISIDERMLSSFDTYYKNLLEWNAVMNLTAITEEKDVYEKHFLDSLTITKIVSRETLDRGLTLLDMGTGAGFPGLPIAIVFPNVKVVLMDSLNKRIKFLEDTVQKLGLTNVTCIHARAEELARNKNYREKQDICCSRAVANLTTLSEYCLPFVKKGGFFISYKTEAVQMEIDQSKKAVKVLGGDNAETVFFTLPGTDYQRSLVKIEKVSATPSKYPRKAGTPGKEPIK